MILVLFSISIAGSLKAKEDKTVIVLNSDSSIDKYSVVHTEFKSRINNPVLEIDLGSKWLDEEEIKEKMIQIDPDIIYCIGSKAYQMAYKMRRDNKLVFSLMINWKRFPAGKNVYGVSNELPQIMQLSMYRYFFPDINKIGVLYSKAYNIEWFKNAVKSAKEVGIEVIGRSIRKPDDIKSALNKLLQEVDAVWLIPDPVVIRDIESVKVIFETSDKARKPVLAYDKAFIGFGATLITSADIPTMGKQAARIVQEILTEQEISERVQDPAGSFNILNMKKVEDYDLQFNNEALDSVNEIVKLSYIKKYPNY
ncbi:MAG: hypothetical protein MRK02_17885 [Candidatus Scalindua sp.]|nr:hypothetical protein [Candidatus Scalindua sp.]